MGTDAFFMKNTASIYFFMLSENLTTILSAKYHYSYRF